MTTRISTSLTKTAQAWFESISEAQSEKQLSRFKRIFIIDRSDAPFEQVSEEIANSYPEAAKFQGADGQWWGIAGEREVNVRWFGAKGDGVTDDTIAFTNALTQVNAGTLIITEGEYLISESLDISRGVNIRGAGRLVTTIFTLRPILLIGKAHGTYSISDLTLEQRGTLKTGIGIGTLTGHPVKAVVERVSIKNFLIGLYNRYSLYFRVASAEFRNNECGIRLARSNNEVQTLEDGTITFNRSNPEATGGFNSWSDGYFHNIVHLDSVNLSGGSVGLMAAGFSSLTLTNTSAEAQNVNTGVLPEGEAATGIWLEGGKDTVASAWNVNINGYYSEATDRQFRAKNVRTFTASNMFFQGIVGSTLLDVDSCGRCKLMDFTGQDYFQHFVDAKNNSDVVLGSWSAPIGVASQNVVKYDATSTVTFDDPKLRFQSLPHFSSTGAGKVVRLPFDIVGHTATISIMYIVDGYSRHFASWVASFQGAGKYYLCPITLSSPNSEGTNPLHFDLGLDAEGFFATIHSSATVTFSDPSCSWEGRLLRYTSDAPLSHNAFYVDHDH